ncbi:MAG: hypothetical protein EKK48_24360 [Candidatus Melainabacteria bacterium]|jgi:hypothetical protein|nr:MAG: hypothetical protein EKK48_24360 [Candidatus Melainabacteria bacterium]
MSNGDSHAEVARLQPNTLQLDRVDTLSQKFYSDASLTGSILRSQGNNESVVSDQLVIPPAPYSREGDKFVTTRQPSDAALPAPVEQAIEDGKPIRFSSQSENKAANRQPDYFLTPDGKVEANPNAQPNQDGSINIEIQTAQKEDSKNLTDTITNETPMQRQWAEELLQHFQREHPGQRVPRWLIDLASGKPDMSDFVPFTPGPNQPVSEAPENGFANRGVRGGGSGKGSGGFAGNGGFDGGGYFKGNGGSGDGSLNTGGTDSRGQPLGAGETVQAKQLYDYFIEKGFSPAQASGILGNLQTESSFKTSAYNAGEGAIGLAQWEGGRRTALEAFAKQEGKPVTDWRVQADFLMKELQTTESGAYSALKAAQTPGAAASAFDKYYERSSGEARGQRMANAENIYRQLSA